MLSRTFEIHDSSASALSELHAIDDFRGDAERILGRREQS